MKFKRITLANLARSSAQEVFDHVANHLLKQMKQSMRHGDCAYRSSDAKVLMCAAGACMTDAEYERIKDAEICSCPSQSGIEGRAWDTLVSAGIVPAQHVEVMTGLQDIHDMNEPNVWREALRQFALNNDLEWKFEESAL